MKVGIDLSELKNELKEIKKKNIVINGQLEPSVLY